MAIEPLSSAMTYQAQTTQQVKALQKPATVKVADVQQKDTQGNGQGTENNTAKEQQQATNEQIKKAVEQLNKRMSQSEAIFGIHEATNRVTIKIVDKDTKEVIKELPPEKTLDMIAKAWELAGLLVDEKR